MAKKNFKQLLNNVKSFVFDIDGVLTDGSVTLMADGQMVRTMNTRDGYALQHAVKNGYTIGVISGGKSEPAKNRLEKLGVHDVYIGITDKLDALKEFMHIHNLKYENILYMGDDMPDYEVMQRCGIPCCPKDAAQEIKELSVYISDKKGGEGCVRDVIEQTMKVHKKWLPLKKKEQKSLASL
ncbi:MAG: HAD-IIIA family hydrolase [Bacteroidetes bacterium]|nr:HAD-IIIA family hydrolase [Bacteroidota bacterium]